MRPFPPPLFPDTPLALSLSLCAHFHTSIPPLPLPPPINHIKTPWVVGLDLGLCLGLSVYAAAKTQEGNAQIA